MEPVNIIIIDDHSLVREGIKQLLELDGDIKVIGEAGNGEDGIELIKTTNPDVVLLDINMPVMNGLQMLQKLKEQEIKVKVLILTIHNEIEYLAKAVEIGINGYVLKDSDSDVLKKAIFTIYEGETYIQPNLAPLLNEKISIQEENAVLNDLTKREIEVLKLLAEGLFNKEIAYKLSISEKTVKNHVSNIFRKIEVFDRTQAAVFAIKNNLVDLF
ncbi:response regulator [Anaerosporobacter faecicola]|uniref:response regulator n=1 Tax=Anaerosporobacter faecicola TaxID=2718714 RepID=UPI001438869F|nr:response regulator transcription factor [Anaerosporobacter faecicola]